MGSQILCALIHEADVFLLVKKLEDASEEKMVPIISLLHKHWQKHELLTSRPRRCYSIMPLTVHQIFDMVMIRMSELNLDGGS